MLPKNIRNMRQKAKKNLAAMKRVLKKMEDYLSSSNPDAICVASAFFHIIEHHMERGDLRPENLNLATMLRGDLPLKDEDFENE
jgi:hypothetical protein